ncbi:DUF5689 domain-containing protein [Myroides odoratimimus]|uniref:DUF5689 domain-containing protein n=1 Tax=Myroides odoratimimus TaxID=76832 RepID=UPI000A641688|nr:DUF5689 domain-containing protein [Myroides odoratimimus]
MKTIFKSLLYFSFAGLMLTGCAKNDDFSVPPVNCNEPNIAANQTIDGLYSTVKEDSKVVAQYTKDETISGIVVSSDQGGNFHQQLYIVDENTQKPVTLKVDIKGAFALYPVGSKVFVKLNGTYIHNSYGMITIGGGIYTSGSGNKYADVITGSKLRNTLYRSCNVITGDEFDKYINVVTLEQLQSDKTLIGKLIRVNEVQFDRSVVGKTYYDKDDKESNDAQGQTLRKMVDKKGNSLVVRTGPYSNAIKDQIIPAESGSITGIVSEFQGTLQFYPRTMEDMKLDQDPFDGGVTPPEEKREGEGVNGENQNTPTYVANFSNWPSFILATNKYGVYGYAKEAKGQGKDGKGAMAINGKPSGNDYVYTVENQSVVKDAKSITMWIKGTSAKSLSFNVFRADGTYAVYNLATDDQIVAKDKPVYNKNMELFATNRVQDKNKLNGQNDYATGTVNAADWIKITLNLKGVDYNTSGKGGVFAFKVGKDASYDLLVSDIVFDGGKDDGGIDPVDPEVPVDSSLVVDFNNLPETQKVYFATVENGIGVDGKKALQFKGEPDKTGTAITLNDVKVPANAKKVTLKLKGSSVDRSLVFNIVKADAKTSNFYSLEAAEANKVLEAKGTETAYDGVIDTKGKWITVTLVLGEDVNKSGAGKFMDIRYGGKTSKVNPSYNVVVDKISFE